MKLSITARAVLVLALAAPLACSAQNLAIVNGKPVPKTRVDVLLEQAKRSGQPVTPELEAQARDQAVLREIFVQAAEERGMGATPEYRARMELARQSILIGALFEDFKNANEPSDADAQAEYDKFKAQASGQEYRARHILVEKEDEAKGLIAKIKAGADFAELAKKHSKDPGSGANGGDLDFSKPDAYVAEFGQAMTALKKGEMTEMPVKTQFGYHIIRLDDTREAPFPPFDQVKDQIKQRLGQLRLHEYQEALRTKAKTDYVFKP